MKNIRNNEKEVKDHKLPSLRKWEQTKYNNTMTIEEAREAEKAFNEELKIFQKAAAMNRKIKEE